MPGSQYRLKCNLDSAERWVDSYFESLPKVNTETGQREVLALKRSNFPKALYRYRSVERLAYTLEELRDGYAFLSNPADFNDPYDSALSASYEKVQKQVLEKFAPAYGYDPNTEFKFFESLEEKEKEEWRVRQQYEQQAYESLLGGLLSLFYGPSTFRDNQDLFSSFRHLVRVSCFTTNPNSVVMWSHYANQHKGICVEFSGSSMLSSTKFSNCCIRCDTRKSSFTLSRSLTRESTSIRCRMSTLTTGPFWRLVTSQKSGHTKRNGG
jgi:hypothetical protein